MLLLNRIIIVLLFLTACTEKEKTNDVVFKIPDPLREGVRKNKIKQTELFFYEVLHKGKLDYRFKRNLSYDTLGNIIEDFGFGGYNIYSYDTNGFKLLHFYSGCTVDKYAILYKKEDENRLSSKWYDLKNRNIDEKIDTTDTFRVYVGANFVFNSKGYLIREEQSPKLNLTYLYDAQNRLVTIIDSLPKNIPDSYFPVRKEFIYNDSGRLTEINEINRVRLISKSKLNSDGLIDSVLHYSYSNQLEKAEVYYYK